MSDKEFVNIVGNSAGSEAQAKAEELLKNLMLYRIALQSATRSLAALRHESIPDNSTMSIA